MSQYLEFKLDCDTLEKIIVDFLIKDNKSDSKDDYRIEHKLANCNSVNFTIVKKIKIGEFSGELKEEFDINDLDKIIKLIVKNDEYEFYYWDYILENSVENPNKKEFKGIIIKLKPKKEEATFINRLLLQ